MEYPKFLLADNSEFPNKLFVLHTEYPRFLMDITNDDVEWFEGVEEDSEEEAENAITELLEAAMAFFDKEMALLEKGENYDV